MAQTILEKIKAYKLIEISEKKKVNPASRLKQRITDKNQRSPFLKAILNKEGKTHSIIAEIKKASPSKGIIRENFDPLNIAKEYLSSGADKILINSSIFFAGIIFFFFYFRGFFFYFIN